jgi:membrane protein implicated in regulation of membrane protease activity
VALALAGDALACTCAPVDLARDLPRADGAFVGTVLERRETEASVLLSFRVEQVYRGDISNRVEVETQRDGATCGLEAPVGERLGLLLERDGSLWRTSLCSQVEPAAFLELTDVEDNALPSLNWGGYVVGFLVLAVAALLLVRRRRRYSGLR